MKSLPKGDIKELIGFQEDLAEAVVQQPEELATQDAYDTQEVVELARQDLDLFAGLVIPDVITMLFPVFFRAVWDVLLEKVSLVRDFSKLALGIPRGFAKTTFMKIFIVYCLIYTTRRCILIVAATATLAENILSDIADMMDGDNIKTLFGNWRIGMKQDNKSQKIFSFRGREITITAFGAGGSIRGLNLKHKRPDVILMEDIQTREGAKSDIESRELYQWMLSTLMFMRAHDGCLYLFVGNMYPFVGSILRKLKSNSQWIKLIAGGILTDGTSLWEELQPVKQLMAELRHAVEAGHPEVFFAEIQNDETAGGRSGIDVRSIPETLPSIYKQMPEGAFIIIDPAGKRKKSNDTVIMRFAVYDGKPHAVECMASVMSPGQTIKNALVMALAAKVPVIAVEDVAYQESLLYWFETFAKLISLEGIYFVPVSPMGVTKVARIKRVFQELLQGEVLVSTDVRTRAVAQIASYDPLSTKNMDDVLDTLGYAQQVIERYKYQITLPIMVGAEDESMNARVYSEQESSCF